MLDLEKFKTGKYFVHLPTEDIYRDAMEFLEKNGMSWEYLKATDFQKWIDHKEETAINFKEYIYYGYKHYYESKGYKELPINFKKSYSVHIGGDDYTDKLGYEDTVSANETKPNDLVKSPNHYIGELGLEVEEVLRNFIPRYEDGYVAHRMASAIEYLLRAPLKNGEQDLEKAGYNIQQALEHIRKKEEK